MAKIQGTVDPRFEGLKPLIQGFLDSGEELGVSFAVNLDGKEVIDLWGGYADETKTRLWHRDTITNLWSSTKPVTSMAALVCIDRGLLNPNEKVAKYWPEFAANGKENVLIRHLLSHTSGVSGWDRPLTITEMADAATSTPWLAEQAPWWEPGTAPGYHSQTYGHLLGEVIKRVSGKPLKQFISEELAQPVNADFQLGAREKDWPRVADTIGIPDTPDSMRNIVFPKGSLAEKTFGNPKTDGPDANTEAWRQGEIGAANGHGNAMGVVRMLSAIATGGSSTGVKLLSPSTIDQVFEEQVRGTDLVGYMPLRQGLGLSLSGTTDFRAMVDEYTPGAGRIGFWGGWGGSVVIVDIDRKLTICYVMNKMANVGMAKDPAKACVRHVYEVLGRG